MITATEAKKLYNNSCAKRLELVARVERRIIEAAHEGKRTTFFYLFVIPSIDVPVCSDEHLLVINTLKERGFIVSLPRPDGDAYVPLGLRDDENNGPLYQGYGIEISW